MMKKINHNIILYILVLLSLAATGGTILQLPLSLDAFGLGGSTTVQIMIKWREVY